MSTDKDIAYLKTLSDDVLQSKYSALMVYLAEHSDEKLTRQEGIERTIELATQIAQILQERKVWEDPAKVDFGDVAQIRADYVDAAKRDIGIGLALVIVALVVLGVTMGGGGLVLYGAGIFGLVKLGRGLSHWLRYGVK